MSIVKSFKFINWLKSKMPSGHFVTLKTHCCNCNMLFSFWSELIAKYVECSNEIRWCIELSFNPANTFLSPYEFISMILNRYRLVRLAKVFLRPFPVGSSSN